jgi:very-short-patch-repair endonuclease
LLARAWLLGDLHRIAVKITQEAIVTLARRQHRNVTRAQLLALGATSNAIQRLVERGWLHREHPGVYSVGTPATTPLELAAAAVLACGHGAVLSHGSALASWGLAKRWPDRVHLSTATDRRPSGLAVHRTTTLARADIRTHNGIRTTSLARTLLDCAPNLNPRALTRAVNDALRSPHLKPRQLADVLERNPRHPGTKLLNPFVQTPTGPTRSRFEDAFLNFCAKHDLPRPKVNTMVCGYEVDALFEQERVIVELDGWDFHNDRRSFEADRARDADTLEAGYATVRITWERLHENPRREAARLKKILASRASAPARAS